jgi:proteobacterial dedicated sortase system histidine kinase
MKLRKQLLLVSLITLTLPWVGCQYIREVESTMRQGHTDALGATAKAVAARLGSDALTSSELNRLNPPPGSVPLFAHTRASPPLIDGYGEDWQQHSLQTLRDSQGQLRTRIAAAYVPQAADKRLYLYLRVTDDSLQYFKPTQQSPGESDHLLIRLNREDGANKLLVYATGAGDLKTAWLDTNGVVTPNYQVTGVSNETKSGYLMEMSLPIEWAEAGLGIEITDTSHSLPSSHNLGREGKIPPLIRASSSLSDELQVFQRSGVRFQIANRGGRPIAQAGMLTSTESQAHEQRHSFLNWFYRLAIGTQTVPILDDSWHTGSLDTPEISHALSASPADNGIVHHGRYQQGSNKLTRVAIPVFDLHAKAPAEPIAVVVADQSTDTLSTITSSAFYKMLFYSMVVTLAASISLITYASWLSLRIRRLSRAAASAISDSGKVADDFPVFTSQDEIGDLSRNYAQLLTRLREYTNYLRSLSSKLSHELRTPLAIVKSSLENLEHEALSDKARTYAHRAMEGTSRLSNILNAMSAASRVEQAIGAAEVETIPCDELLTNLKGAYQDVYQNATFTLNIRRDEGPLKLQGSGELLVQMFDKLVDNAADFCPKEGKIELGLYRRNDRLIFTVHNQGPPLPRHMHGQLFDSMVSVREKPSGPEGGQHLGLGLYIVRLIADFHRGEVQCYNVPDHSGVIFEVSLPVD